MVDGLSQKKLTGMGRHTPGKDRASNVTNLCGGKRAEMASYFWREEARYESGSSTSASWNICLLVSGFTVEG